jgi:hypothetical protein
LFLDIVVLPIIAEIRERWDTWDLKDKVQGDNMLQFDSFYNGFMAPYFACYRCSDTKKAIQAPDMIKIYLNAKCVEILSAVQLIFLHYNKYS